MIVDDEHALDHAGQDRFHARTIGGEICRAASDLAHRSVERARDDADLVGAVVACGPGPVAGSVSLRDRRDRADAAAEEDRDRPCQQQRDEPGLHAKATSAMRRTADELRVHIGQGHRQAELPAICGSAGLCTGTATYSMSVPHRRAMSPRQAEPFASRLLNLGPVGVVLDGAELLGVEIGVADDGPSAATRVTRRPAILPSASASASSSAPACA